MNIEKIYNLLELTGSIDEKYILQSSSCVKVKIRKYVMNSLQGCLIIACMYFGFISLINLFTEPASTIDNEVIIYGLGTPDEFIVADPNDHYFHKAYPTIYVNGNYYEWRRGVVRGVRDIIVAPKDTPPGLRTSPEEFLNCFEYYGEIIHYTGDYQCPKEDRELVSWFDVEGAIYLNPQDDSTIYLYMELPWMEYAVVAFDKIEKPTE